MAEGHIYIYGEIIPWQDNNAAEYGGVNLKDVSKQIQSYPDSDTLVAHIHSPGGDVFEGFAIHDALRNSGKKITTVIEGLCASIATVIALAGDERKITENSQFMIHNPWGMAMGDSSDLSKYADDLQREENRMAEFYASKIGGNVDDIKAMMKEETWMTADEAKEKGFVNDIIKELKAVAKINLNNNKMDKEFQEKTEKQFTKINALLEKVSKFFAPKALILTDADGVGLDFGPDVVEQMDIKPGVPIKTTDGSDLKPEYTLPDGTIIRQDAGVVTEVVEPVVADDDVEALKQQIADLQSQLDAKNAEVETAIQAKTDAETKFKGLEKDVNDMKAMVSDMSDTFEKKLDRKANENVRAGATAAALH